LRRKVDMKGPVSDPWRDSRGPIGYLFEITQKNNLVSMICMILRGSDLYKSEISTTRDILIFCKGNGIPVVAALEWDKDVHFFVYDAEWLLDGNVKDHSKFPGVVNFLASLGEEWNPGGQMMGEVIARLKERHHEDRVKPVRINTQIKTLSEYFMKIDEETKKGGIGDGSTQKV